jgi:hypothetical protein
MVLAGSAYSRRGFDQSCKGEADRLRNDFGGSGSSGVLGTLVWTAMMFEPMEQLGNSLEKLLGVQNN